MTGLEAATSGVAQPQPKLPGTEGSLCAQPFCPPKGLAMLGWLMKLNSSPRNCAPKRSGNFQFLSNEKSQFLKPESLKVFRPISPKVPGAGGVITELRTL